MWYERLASRRKPDLTIENDGKIYMQRWFLIPHNRFLNIYLHRISGPDEPTPHDHPWCSLSYCLRGLMRESRPQKRLRLIFTKDFIFRLPTTLHYLENVSSVVWTIFITGPKVREWGFDTFTGWEPYYMHKGRDKIKEY